MAGPSLPTNLTTLYPPVVGEDPTAQPHRNHHSTVHQIVNQFNYPSSPASGDVPLHDGTAYVPSSLTAAVTSIVNQVLAASATVGNTVTIFGGNSERVHPVTGAAIPAGTSVLWVAATAPINFVENQDIWLNRPEV